MSRLDPALKDALYREKSERMELRRDMEEQTEKIDFEIEAFCNAVRRAVSEKIFRDAALSKSAKKLVNHRLEQMAVSVAAPLRHEWVSAARDGKLKETQVEPGVYIINAVTRMRNTLEGLQTNLELELAPATYTFAEEYITKALQLLAESIPAQRISVLKRLDEYAKL